MANDQKNVSVGKPLASGAIWVGAVGTTLPTDTKTALASGFQDLGYVSEDGLTNGVETDSEEIKEWSGDTVLAVQTSRSETFGFTLLETNEAVLSEVYDASNVTKSANLLTVKHNGKEKAQRSWVFELVLTGNRRKRIVVPNAKITEVGEVTYQSSEAIGYEVTLTAFPDADGNTAIEYIELPATTTTTSGS